MWRGIKTASVIVICLILLLNRFAKLLTDVSIRANSVDTDQNAPVGAVYSGPTLFVQETSKTFQQTTQELLLGVIGPLRVT